MLNRFDFVSFTPTPGEKYTGIAEIKIYGQINVVLRYKVVPKKDGSGHFPTCASYKMVGRSPGEEYDECFMIDSRSDNDAINKCVMRWFHHWQISQQPSVFNEPQIQAQPYPNYNQVPQPLPVPFVQRPEYQPDFLDAPKPPNIPDYENIPF